MENNNTYLDLLLYYKGEKSNPFAIDIPKHTYWELEYMWFNQVLPDEDVLIDYSREFIVDFPDLCNNILEETPMSLKAFMYNRYCQFGGTQSCFESWLMNYKQNSII